ncbi:hypothetical protein MAR_012425 [Mya arenaria]|uniref:Uncharacterized protein n=1 Tax=Mya arenaria TaxID=6604 RepID=A0ABY7G140_MYAAR|nr:hypothetical protein MAR_012425 [Mya arenaria]
MYVTILLIVLSNTLNRIPVRLLKKVDSIVKLNTFNTVYRKDVNNFSGGILVYVNNDLESKRVAELENALSESIWIEIIDGVQIPESKVGTDLKLVLKEPLRCSHE